MHRLATAIAAALSLAMLACTAPNPHALLVDDPDDAADSATDAVPGADAAEGDAASAGGSGGDAVVTDDPETCDGVSERHEIPTCHGGTLERSTDGSIVCHWPCVGLAEITAVVVESAPGCFALDDMICHQCTEQLPSSWEPSPMPCPDVVRMLW